MDSVFGIYLLLNSITDLKSRRIYVWVSVLAAVAGIIEVSLGDPDWLSLLEGVFLGTCLYLFSLMSRGAVGTGDGLVVAVSGIFLGGKGNLLVLMGGFILAAGSGGILILIKRATRKTELPFVPFFSISYVVFRLGGVL